MADCEDCDRENDFDDMVSCDHCHKWWHFVCAGVDVRIKKIDWECSLCKGKKSSVDKDVVELRVSMDKMTVDSSNSKKAVETKETLATVENALSKLDHALPSKAVRDSAAEGLKATFNLSKTLPCKTLDQLADLLLYVTQSDSLFTTFVKYIQSFFTSDVQKSIKKVLDVIMHKDVQRQLSWSGLRTTLPSFELHYKPIVDAINQALMEKFADYNYEVLEKKLQKLLGKK